MNATTTSQGLPIFPGPISDNIPTPSSEFGAAPSRPVDPIGLINCSFRELLDGFFLFVSVVPDPGRPALSARAVRVGAQLITNRWQFLVYACRAFISDPYAYGSTPAGWDYLNFKVSLSVLCSSMPSRGMAKSDSYNHRAFRDGLDELSAAGLIDVSKEGYGRLEFDLTPLALIADQSHKFDSYYARTRMLLALAEIDRPLSVKEFAVISRLSYAHLADPDRAYSFKELLALTAVSQNVFKAAIKRLDIVLADGPRVGARNNIPSYLIVLPDLPHGTSLDCLADNTFCLA